MPLRRAFLQAIVAKDLDGLVGVLVWHRSHGDLRVDVFVVTDIQVQVIVCERCYDC